MMYTTLNTLFLAIAVLAYIIYMRRSLSVLALAITLGILLTLTAIFDHLIITAGIVTYDTNKLSGVFVGASPIEDFDYAIAAVILIPTLWHTFSSKKGGSRAQKRTR